VCNQFFKGGNHAAGKNYLTGDRDSLLCSRNVLELGKCEIYSVLTKDPRESPIVGKKGGNKRSLSPEKKLLYLLCTYFVIQLGKNIPLLGKGSKRGG